MHDTRSMRVVAQNLWARFGDWPRRRGALRDGLRRADPDLAAFVEAVKTDEYAQAEDLPGPGYETVYEPPPPGGGGSSPTSRPGWGPCPAGARRPSTSPAATGRASASPSRAAGRSGA